MGKRRQSPLTTPKITALKHTLKQQNTFCALPDGESYKTRKRVRFSRGDDPDYDDEDDENYGSVMTTERGSDIVRSDLHKPTLWWTRQERASILSDCQDAIKSFCSDHDDQVQHYIGVFDRCCDSLSKSSSDYIENATVVLPDDIRGLEWGFSSKNHRRQHVLDILDVQERCARVNPEMRDRLLSSQSVRSSRCCLLIARKLGEGDRIPLEEETQRNKRRRRNGTSLTTHW